MNNIEVVAWRVFDTVTDAKSLADEYEKDGWQVEPLVSLTSAQAEINEQKRRNDELNREISGVRRSYFEERKRATAAEKERDALLTAINQVGLDAEQKEWIANFVNRQREPHDAT